MRAFIAGNEVLRFACEVVALASFGWAAWHLTDSAARIVLAIAAVVIGADAWGVLVAPRSQRRLTDPARLAVEVVFFGLAGVALASVDHPVWGIILAITAIANAIVLRRHPGVLGAIG